MPARGHHFVVVLLAFFGPLIPKSKARAASRMMDRHADLQPVIIGPVVVWNGGQHIGYVAVRHIDTASVVFRPVPLRLSQEVNKRMGGGAYIAWRPYYGIVHPPTCMPRARANDKSAAFHVDALVLRQMRHERHGFGN